MANTKEYQIKINGISESINAVDSLNNKLQNLEQRINAVNTSKVSSAGGSSRTSNVSSLSEEERLAKQIEQIDQKREAYSKEIYQNYLAAKEIMDETVKDQKQLAAAERLSASSYSNTMRGMKQELADIKQVMQTVDLGDTAEFDKLTQRANELNEALKEIEKTYGQFGRNVGNYKSAFDGIDKIAIEVGGVAREFGSAREASKTLKNELTALEIQGKGNTEEAKELRKAFYQLQSAMDDATKSSKAMDTAMDWMSSFTAMASVGNGLKAFFGFDDNEITKSIQKLVALQNVLNGIETIRKQMDTEEGIGSILGKGSKGVDKFVASITGAEMGVSGLMKSSRLATIAVRGLSIALKGVGIGLAVAAISVLVDLVQKAGTAIQDYFKGNAEIMDSAHLATAQIEAENNAFKQQKAIVSSRYMQGLITDYEYAVESVYNLTDALKDNITAMHQHMGEVQGAVSALEKYREGLAGNLQNGNGIMVRSDWFDVDLMLENVEKAKKSFSEYSLAVQQNMDIIESKYGWFGGSIKNFFNSFVMTADDAKDDLVQIGQAIAGDWVARMSQVDRSTATTEKDLEELRKQVKPLIDEFNNDEILRTILMNLDNYFPDEAIKARIKNVIDYAQQLSDGVSFMTKNKDVLSKEGYNYWEQVYIDGLDAVKQGSEKIQRQIALNRKKEIEALTSKYGTLTKERLDEINKKYAQQEADQLKQINQRNRDAQNELNNLNIQLMKEGLDKQIAQLNQERKEKIQKITESGILVGKRTQAINALYDKKIVDEKKKWAAEMIKVYEDMQANIQSINRATFNTQFDTQSQNLENNTFNRKQEIGYTFINSSNFDNSKVLEQYYQKILDLEKEALNQENEIKKERLAKELYFNQEEEKLRHERLVNAENGEYKKQLEAGKLTQLQYNQLMEDENRAHNARMQALDEEYASNLKNITTESLQEEQRLYNSYFSNIITDVKKDKQKIDEIMQKQPETDTQGWDVVLALKVKKTYRTVITQYENLKKDIIKKQQDLEIALKNGRISPEDFAMRQSELKQELKAINDAVKDVTEKQKNLVKDFVQSIQVYIQKSVGSFMDIMNAVWDAQDNNNDKEAEQLDKANEILEKKLDKQQEIVEQHKSKIDSIEDELSTARGDRRQHLIDQLNAEMRAQREAQAQEKKIQKEKEANERKQDELEKKRKKQQYHRDMLQAVVNGAMAVTYALVNKWPIPAIPMAALAASTAAAQIGIMAANKPYAKGGLLEGKSHAEGGIPVGNTGIEVEGKEYIIRKKSTAPNIEILDYINKSERKLDLDDFIEFYSSGKVKKNISQISPKSRFADGGTIPTLNSDYSFDDRLLNAFEDYSNRPVYVSVQDINSRQKAVKNVQVLAGLDV